MSIKKRGLGRGLEALLGSSKAAAAAVTPEEAAGDALRMLALGLMQPGRFQPRTGMDAARLTELAPMLRGKPNKIEIRGHSTMRPLPPDKLIPARLQHFAGTYQSIEDITF